ncbi:metal-dependent hydrolase [Hazenella coriacea]|uniref:Inner membrane protein n=1 Tax=Hazenella coriacea TaxID=1179467 RepID=A0A4R3L5Z2_9BACL|nr:metal-dependent hydrolase [Hazenella coriacea]TCS92799.1 inner membrane protein [Hazenella coriacea]
MDTGTHFVMGVGLFGLAHIDPSVVNHADTSQAVLLGTIIGSQMPDIDTIYRFKGNATYIRNHRGWSHSLPMLLLWPVLLTLLLSFIFPNSSWTHLWIWTQLAVLIHIFIDCFNTYGTQAIRPLSYRWISWNIINIFDPFIFTIHVIGFMAWWITPLDPGSIFALIYGLIIVYVLWRTWVHYRLVQWIQLQIEPMGKVTVTPTIRWNVWNVIVEHHQFVKMGTLVNKKLTWTGQLTTENIHHPAVISSKQTDPIDAFLSFTSYGYPQVYQRSYGFEVRWLDVRYHYKKHFPFVAVALIDKEYKPFHSFVGWMNEGQLEKKIRNLVS